MGLVLLSLAAAVGAAQPSVIVPPWRTVQVTPGLAEFYADHLAQALRHEGLTVFTASEVNALLSFERQRQLLSCTCTEESPSCFTELGNALGCEAVLLVSLAKLEDLYRGNLKILDTRDGAVLVETHVEATGQKALLGALERSARRLAEGLQPSPRQVADVHAGASGGTRRFYWIPASIAALGAVVGAVGLIGSQLEYAALARSFAAPHAITPPDEASAARGKALQLGGWVGVGVAAAGLVSMVAVLLFGSPPPVTPALLIGPRGAAFALEVRVP